MTTIDPSKYRFVPGESEVVDLELDKAGLHTLTGEPITEQSMLEASLEAEKK
ncbi:MAG: hypothetical protein FWG08_03540 [Propionibacteriaceae bacterium]|nr:hypothetical protein [Propionibacteriaceae bacterium]